MHYVSRNESTSFFPFEIVFGRKGSYYFDNEFNEEKYYKYESDRKGAADFILDLKSELNKMHEAVRKPTEGKECEVERKFQVGEKVWVKIKPEVKGIYKPRYEGPFEIKAEKGNGCVVLVDKSSGRIVERNIHHLKKYNTKSDLSQRQTSIHSRNTSTRNKYQNQTTEQSRYPHRERKPPLRYQ